MKTVEWRPDTCDCVIQMKVVDGEYIAIESTTDPFGVVYNRYACERHKHIEDVQEHYQAVLLENRKKNEVYTDLLQMNPDAPQRFSISELGIMSFVVTQYLTPEQLEELEIKYPDVIFT